MSAAAIRASQKSYGLSAAIIPVWPSSASTASARAMNQVICFGGDSFILFLLRLLFDSVFENKGYFHLDAILGDMSFIIDEDFLILDPCSSDIGKSFLGARNSRLDRIIETLGRRGFDFSDPCDCHWRTPFNGLRLCWKLLLMRRFGFLFIVSRDSRYSVAC